MTDFQAPLREYEVTLRVKAHTDASQLLDLFDHHHAFGPIQSINVNREGHTAHRGFNADLGEYIDVESVDQVE